MYRVQDWAEVHRLFFREGWSKTDIAEKLGMSRNTVARLVGLEEPPTSRRRRRGSKLDPYRGAILGMLDEDAEVPATVILECLRREGYGGGITILKEYLAEVRPLFVDAKSYQRTTYLPGELAQVDWWEPPVRVPVGKGAVRRVFGLVTTLPHSAAHACVFSFSKGVADFCWAFVGTLQRLGRARRRWWWIGTPRSWCRILVLLASIRRWQRCSERSGSVRSSWGRGSRSRRGRWSTPSATWRRRFCRSDVSRGSRTCRTSTTAGPARWRSLGITGGWEPRWPTPGWSNGDSSPRFPIPSPIRTAGWRCG